MERDGGIDREQSKHFSAVRYYVAWHNEILAVCE